MLGTALVALLPQGNITRMPMAAWQAALLTKGNCHIILAVMCAARGRAKEGAGTGGYNAEARQLNGTVIAGGSQELGKSTASVIQTIKSGELCY